MEWPLQMVPNSSGTGESKDNPEGPQTLVFLPNVTPLVSRAGQDL